VPTTFPRSLRNGATEVSRNQLKASSLNAIHDASGTHEPALTASVEVTNIGSRAAEEVVQLYVRLQGTSVAQPMRALKGFRRVALAPAETKKVTFDLGPEAFAMWHDRNQFAVEPAKVSIWISPDSARGTAGAVEIVP